MSTSAWPDKNFSGHIARIAPSVSASSRTLSIEAEIENNSGVLKPGQFATVRILQNRPQQAVLVPKRAVVTENDSSHVFVIKNGHAELRLVQIGQTEGDLLQVKSGVASGELIATGNLEQLTDGAAVKQI
jgi:RND family efflux transporter MFP subunit